MGGEYINENWLNQAQIQIQEHLQETCPICPNCSPPPSCPEWTSGFLDIPLQWVRQFGNWADLLLSSFVVFAVILVLIFMPFTRNILGFFVKILKTAWDATKKNEEKDKEDK